MNTTFINKILKSLINHNKESADINQMINESTEKINKIKLTEEEKKYITKKYNDYVNIIKYSINENSDDDFQQKVSHKRKFIKNVVDSVVNESKLIWKPTQLTFHRDGGWENKNFLKGTLSIAENISKNTIEKSLISILGGGDTLAAINKSNEKLTFSHLSTAGGAFLEYLEGKDLPGISVLK